MLRTLRKILDSITMYRVVLYGLIIMAVSAFTLSFLNILTYSSLGTLLISFGLLSAVCFTTNTVLSKLFSVTANHESSIITTIILFFVLASPTNKAGWAGIGFAALVAIASKYVVSWRSAHIFNPAALGVLVVSVLGIGNGAWWVADKSLFAPMLVIGFLVLLKLRRFSLFWSFFIPALLIIIAKDSSGTSLLSVTSTALTLYPLLFLGTIMLTEPSTMPATQNKRLIYGGIVGVIFALNLDLGFIATSPHLALILGNLFAFAVTRRSSARLMLVGKTQLTPTTYEFSFKPSRPLTRTAGQYIELTVPGVKLDSRGNRRTFTVASAPSEEHIKVGVKFYEHGSQFKNKLMALKNGEVIMGNHIAGDFTLPKDSSGTVLLVAGGIGITPYIAMIKEIIASGVKRNVELYYFVNDKSELAYKNILKNAQDAGIKIHLRVGKGIRLTEEEIEKHVDAHYYLSGPPGLVNGYKAQLQKLKVKRIHTDLFTGY